MAKVVPSFCRNCLAYCPILVTVEDGRAVKVAGDPDAPLYEGYTCPKGRALPAQHNDPTRLRHSRKRNAEGAFSVVASDQAVVEVTEKIQEILERYGPRSVAIYTGTGPVSTPTGSGIAKAWLRAIKSRMLFNAGTLDKPAEYTSTALHGNWVAGAQSFESSDTWMIVGGNPVIAKSNGAPYNNPGQRLKEAVRRGLKLIVIDPRRTETARRAGIHLQARPGEDPPLLAAMIRVIIEEGLHDQAFIDQHAEGLNALRDALTPFTPEYAAARAGVSAQEIVDAARTFGRAKRGCAVCSTGPSFSTYSNLTFYLALCLNTVCGRWTREGERAPHPNVLLPAFTPRAQPYAPYPVFGAANAIRVNGFRENASGLPSAALADEILEEGDGRIRALFCLGGNPVLAWPDQRRTEAALNKLDLLVVFDYQMTATAEFADYVIAPPLSLEVPASTQKVESLKYHGVTRGYTVPWAQYSPAVATPPPGSDLMDDGEFFFRMAQRMQLQLEWTGYRGPGPQAEDVARPVAFDMARPPTTEELVELTCAGSRVPLSEVKNHAHGRVFDEIDVRVQARDPACTARLQLADPLMMQDLKALCVRPATMGSDAYPYRLVCRRANKFMNSFLQALPGLHAGKPYNPAFMHSADAAALKVEEGAIVRVRSPHGEIQAVLEIDDSLRTGVIAMTHGFGRRRGAGREDPRAAGSSVQELLSMEERDPISGIPRMSAVPVAVERL